jgi:hypothetical protein
MNLMALKVMIVTNSKYQTFEGDRDLTGTFVPVGGNPYEFYAVEMIRGKDSVSETQSHEVSMVLPIGGVESGLFRFPRVGDKVLVSVEDNAFCYLMGYLPNGKNNNFYPHAKDDTGAEDQEEINRVLQKEASVFRYRKTGGNPSRDAYSEIGFYKEPTQWKGPEDSEFPELDRINIRSTGDIKSRAENHHEIAAKRFELLVDCPETDHGAGEAAFGDGPGDDTAFYAGDAHIRAKTRVVIKAGQEIRLQVGRSAIIISDDGITITSRKTRRNRVVSWDTVMSLSPRDGIALFGQKVSIGAAYNFSLRESGGGSLSSLGGVVRLSGKDILAQSYNKTAFQVNTAEVEKFYNSNLKAMGGTEKVKVPSYTALLPSMVNIFNTINWGYLASGSNYADPEGDYTNYCALLLQILSVTYTVLDITMPADLREKEGGRDALNLAALENEYKTVKEMLSHVVNAAAPARAIHNSFLHLTASADAILGGFGIKNLFVEMTNGVVPTAGTNPSLLKKEMERMQKDLGSWGGTAEGTTQGLLKEVIDHVEEGNLWAVDISEAVLQRLKEL